MAILLQALCVRLGVATGRDLAQACRDYYSKPTSIALWLLCEIAIVNFQAFDRLESAREQIKDFGVQFHPGDEDVDRRRANQRHDRPDRGASLGDKFRDGGMKGHG